MADAIQSIERILFRNRRLYDAILAPLLTLCALKLLGNRIVIRELVLVPLTDLDAAWKSLLVFYVPCGLAYLGLYRLANFRNPNANRRVLMGFTVVILVLIYGPSIPPDDL